MRQLALVMTPLPFPLSSLVGRESDIRTIATLLEQGARLVTLTGLGGVGKTRLAIATAQRLVADGLACAYCDVAGAEGVPDLALALAEALGVELPPEEAAATWMTTLAAMLQARRSPPLLLVIDNFERLVAAPGAVAGLRQCLEHAPWLSALVTSRIGLPPSVGMTFAVDPIAAAGPGSPAVRLLVERAAQVGAFVAWHVGEPALVCLAQRLEGLPLALELVAARAHLAAPDELLHLVEERLPAGGSNDMTRLRDAVVAWSWGVLSREQREALRRVEVIEGTFDFELAATLVGGTRDEAMQVLDALVRVSLITVEQVARTARYRMLDTVREFVRAAVPGGRDQAHDDMAEALLARCPPEDEMTLVTRSDPTFVLSERDRFMAVVRHGLAPDASLRSVTLALRAATWLLLALRRTGFGSAIAERVETLLERPDCGQVPLPIRQAASMLSITLRVSDPLTGEVDVLLDRLDRWTSTAQRERPRLMALLLRGLVAQYRWNFQEVHRIGEVLAAHPLLATELGLQQASIQLLINGRRALGRGDFTTDDALAAHVFARLLSVGDFFNALLLQSNRAFHAVHLGRPDVALALTDDVERVAKALGYAPLEALARRGRGRAELDLGRRREALASFDAWLSHLPGTREAVGGLLERCATALEAGRYEEVRRDLDAVGGTLSTRYELGYHAALEHALAALTGDVPIATRCVVTDTIEDTAFQLLMALGSPTYANAALLAAARAHAPFSFRVRQAQRLFDAAHALVAGSRDVIGVDFEAHAFRLGVHWVHLAMKPLLATLFESLARAHLEGEPYVERARLVALGWPDSKEPREHLERRLETALSSLRKLGLDAIAARRPAGGSDGAGGGYALDPSLAVLRVQMSAWTIVESAPAPPGRGRPLAASSKRSDEEVARTRGPRGRDSGDKRDI